MSLPSRRLRRALAVVLTALLAGSALTIGPAGAAPSGRAPGTAEAAPFSQPERVRVSTGRLDPVLAALARASAEKGARGARALAEKSGVPIGGDRVSVIVQAEAGALTSAEKAAKAAGATVTGQVGDALRVTVSPAALPALASAPGVLRVRRPMRPRKLAVKSEGVLMTNADRWQARGIDGSGTKVGVIDVGYANYQELESLGYLPPASRVSTAVFDASAPDGIPPNIPPHERIGFEDEAHGAAVAETVHDVAPGAELYLAAIYDEVDLEAALAWMRANGVQVINMSLGWIGMPLDGGVAPGSDTIVNSVVSSATANGIFWANAAGNFRLNHWRGDFYDREGDFALNWDGWRANYNVFQYNGADPIEGILWWRDSWTNAINDYDLVLFHWDWSLRGGTGDWASVDPGGGQGEHLQWGRSGDQPLEDVYVLPGTLPAGTYAWAVVNMRPWAQRAVTGQHGYLPANNKRVDFDFFSPNQDLTIYRPSRSIMTPADNQSGGFMAVGAIGSQWAIGGPGGRPGLGIQELYSSEGPNQNGFLAPEISAPDDTTNFVAQQAFGGNFRGTSASAPHLAGLAALVAAAHPAFHGPQIEQYIKDNAIGLADPGADTHTGWGAANLPATRTVDLARLSGPTRYQTALAISSTWATGSVANVVLASGANFPDALAGGSLAGGLSCPVLLTPPLATTGEILAELHRLTSGAPAPAVYILGSEAAVSRTVADQLSASGFRVVRMGGGSRYDTASGIARKSLDLRPSDTAFIVNGAAFPDALSAAPISYKRGFPVLPVYKFSIPAAIQSVIVQCGIKHAVIVGSTSVVSSAVQARLAALGVSTERWSGATRWDTSRDVAEKAFAKGWVDFAHVGMASGGNFPDALSGAPEAGRDGGAVLLTVPNRIGDQALSVIGDHAAAISKMRVYGGEPALQGAILLQARVRSDH
ncbi:MAG TPA: cell wall-binding repeat-containing protein [Coriobacteriia bacterium]|jgi:putative cell wall-binding protein